MVTVISIIVLVLIGIYLIMGIIVKKRLMLNKFTFVVMAIAIVALLISSHFGKDQENIQVENPSYHKKAPPVQYAPRVAATRSRVYYVATFQDNYYLDIPNGDYTTLTAFYFYDRKNWEYADKPLPFKKADIRIFER